MLNKRKKASNTCLHFQ